MSQYTILYINRHHLFPQLKILQLTQPVGWAAIVLCFLSKGPQEYKCCMDFNKARNSTKTSNKNIFRFHIFSQNYLDSLIVASLRLSSKASLTSPTSRYVWHVWPVWRLFRRALFGPGLEGCVSISEIHSWSNQTNFQGLFHTLPSFFSGETTKTNERRYKKLWRLKYAHCWHESQVVQRMFATMFTCFQQVFTCLDGPTYMRIYA